MTGFKSKKAAALDEEGMYLVHPLVFSDFVPPQPAQEPVKDQWTPCMKLPVVVHVRKQRPGEAHVSTREGITPVKPDDLIMRGVSGEEYPIGRAIFEQTYSLDTTPPAQPVQEPVEDVVEYFADGTRIVRIAAKRPWVDLTDEDLNEIFAVAMTGEGAVHLALEKIKEKNT